MTVTSLAYCRSRSPWPKVQMIFSVVPLREQQPSAM